ncbi:sulfate transporter-like [Paramacrobiotus metropolitanus]|uniref:sulfate transporter-like n=1 Tax=Paramacrobiotus metropolitanus TaxID=2943436 RepID=UPI00244579A1|nr:sulfate transporter-like [Paramacrobiotus metropolitanus]
MASDSDVQVTYAVGDYNVEGSQNTPARLRVSRAVYDQPNFDTTYGLCAPGPPLTPWDDIKRIARKKWRRKKATSGRCDRVCMYNVMVKWFPIIDWLGKYKWREYLVTDVIAGLTVGVLNVPQGMAYALLAHCPPVTGLYTSFFPIIVYLLMGTSRQCSMGTFSIISMMTSKSVNEFAPELMKVYNETGFNDTSSLKFHNDQFSQIQVASTLALIAGVWQLLFGLLGFGGLCVYLSDQLVQGFTCGAAFHVFTSQLKNVFAIPGLEEQYGIFKIGKTYKEFFQRIGGTHPATVIVALLCMVVLVVIKIGINDNRRLMKKLRGIPIPAELLIVIGSTVASYLMNLGGTYNVETVKVIPQGLPPFTSPDFSLVWKLLPDSISNAIVGLAITVTLGMLFASKHGYTIDPNQEFKAQGIGNIFSCWFRCFPQGASVARSAVQNDVGGKTQIVSVVQCIIVLIVMLFLGRYLQPLPKPALGAIVMVSVFHLLAQVVQLRRLWKLSLVDWSIFLVVFLGVLILDVDVGLGIGVGWAIMTIMLRLQKPKVGPLGRLPGTDIYRRTDVYRTATEVPGVKIVRVDAPIYFANVAYIKQRLYALADIQNLIQKHQEDHPKAPDGVPGIPDDATNYAYSLHLQLGEDRNAREEALEFGSRFGGSTISMEELFTSSKGLVVRTQSNDREDDEENLPVRHLIIDCSEICFIDVTGVGFLKVCKAECESVGVELLLACTNKPVRDILALCGAMEHIKDYQLFVTVHDAVLYAVNAQKFKNALADRDRKTNPTVDEENGIMNQGFGGRRLDNLVEEDEETASVKFGKSDSSDDILRSP